MTFYLYFHWAG